MPITGPPTTPEPWACIRGVNSIEIVCRETGELVATVEMASADIDFPASSRAEGNARLIAAAPSMADVLAQAVELLELPEHRGLERLRIKARAALAIAGRQVR